MELDSFADQCELYNSTELDRVRLIAFYLYSQKEQIEYSISTITGYLDELHLPKPNTSRLKAKIKDSSSFLRGSTADSFKLHRKEIKLLESEYPQLVGKSESVVSEDTILSSSLMSNTRGFIESLSRQINGAYQFNIFDGCAVLMRRLLEILLIMAHEHQGIGADIKNSDDSYVSLDSIINNAKQSKALSLSKGTKQTLNIFRELGNFSAHKIYYNARRNDIDQIKVKYRVTIEELLYKSGLRT
ncbi:MAG: hypothetical protein KME67_15760 [Candidatus Thiodiazotropha sp. (ex Codakia orbicularis)]|nr:hypothetical protein [Candidatus Thiodiazotropha sp. (ex Codakia orbicularis)]